MYDLLVIVLLIIGFWLFIKYLSDRYEQMPNYKCDELTPKRKKEWFNAEYTALCDSNNRGMVKNQTQININHDF